MEAVWMTLGEQMTHEISLTKLAEGLTDDQLNILADHCEREFLNAGEQLCRNGDLLTKLYIVDTGCMVLKNDLNRRHPLMTRVTTGETFGEYGILSNEPILTDVFAEFDTWLITIPRDSLLVLLEKIPRLLKNLERSFSQRLKGFVNGEKIRRFARSVVFVRVSDSMSTVISQIANRLKARGERIVILSETNSDVGDVDWRQLELGQNLVERLSVLGKTHDRAIIDLHPEASSEFFEVLDVCDEVFWAFESKDDKTLVLLDEFLKNYRSSSPQTAHVKRICLLPPGEKIVPKGIEDVRLKKRDFILASSETGTAERLHQQGIDRLVRHLCDVKIGLALAGGGAKGLAHFGVLRALDRAGISFDIMSGTSAGSMFGLSYAAGLETDFMIDSYTNDLTPPKSFKFIPGGDRLYLIWKYRTHSWLKMLLPYFHDWTIEQLAIPFSSVAVDLVEGKQVITESGNMIEAMLDSLNLPGIAKPILKNGRALVDGGILNNLPADVLADRNADLIVGVNVGAGLAQEFGGNRPGMSTRDMKMPGNIETLFRIFEVIGKGSAEYQTSSIDLLIQPDTSEFSFSDFTKGQELAEIGEAAMNESIDELRKQLVELTRFKRQNP